MDFGREPFGSKNLKYSVDGGATQTVLADNTDVTISALADHSNDGLHTIEYWATDNASNVESPHNSTTVKIDTKQPSSTDNNDHTCNNSAYTMHLAATDTPARNTFSTSSYAPAPNTFNANSSTTNTVDPTINNSAAH